MKTNFSKSIGETVTYRCTKPSEDEPGKG